MQQIDRKYLGPIIGNPPTLEWVAVGMLEIDRAYQRSMESAKSRRIVLGMVKQWDWRRCQPLIVTRRGDGALMVLDGQHRLEGARQRGDVPHLPCFVCPAMAVEAEAEVFVKLNTERQRLTQGEVFAGMLAAGDPEALKVAAMLRETGWELARHSNTAHYKAGQLECAPMLARQVKQQGEAAVRNALTALREAFPEVPVRAASTLLRALIDLYASARIDDPDCLIDALGGVDDPADWLLEAQIYQRENPAFSRREALAEVLYAGAQSLALEAA